MDSTLSLIFNMVNNLSIGLYHPSIPLPSHILDKIQFVTATPHCEPKGIREFYPQWQLPIRKYVVGENQLKNKGIDFLKTLQNTNYLPALKQYARSGLPVQIVFNELFKMDGNLKNGINKEQLSIIIDAVSKQFVSSEIIFNEMNTYRITQYIGNGFQDNGVLRFIQQTKEQFPSLDVSLGIQTIGNYLCKDLILKSLPIVLSYIKSLEWFVFPVHFTEVGYYHPIYSPHLQAEFLDNIRSIALAYEVSSLCYIYPWDGDYFHLAGQPRNAICGIWDEDWNVKYDIQGI